MDSNFNSAYVKDRDWRSSLLLLLVDGLLDCGGDNLSRSRAAATLNDKGFLILAAGWGSEHQSRVQGRLCTLLFGCFWHFELQSCHLTKEILIEGHSEMRQAFAIWKLSRVASCSISWLPSLVAILTILVVAVALTTALAGVVFCTWISIAIATALAISLPVNFPTRGRAVLVLLCRRLIYHRRHRHAAARIGGGTSDHVFASPNHFTVLDRGMLALLKRWNVALAWF